MITKTFTKFQKYLYSACQRRLVLQIVFFRSLLDGREVAFQVLHREKQKISGPCSVKQIESAIRVGKLKGSDNFSARKSGPWNKLQDLYLVCEEIPYEIKQSFFQKSNG